MADHPASPVVDDRAVLRRSRRLLLGVAVVLVAGILLSVLRNTAEFRTLAAETAAKQTPAVAIAVARPSAEGTPVEYAGSVKALNEAAVRARTAGYVRQWRADLGQRVAAGSTLVELDAPELDHELAQGRAQLAQARASADVARKAAARWQDLRQSDAVSAQEADDKAAAAAELDAAVRAAQANVSRLEELSNFKKVTAPFAGVITARSVEVGQLVAAGAGDPLYVLQQIDPIRVFISVAQADIARVPPGAAATIVVPERPGVELKGTVARVAGGLDPASRTRLTEIDVPNHDGQLLPGTYVRVRLADARHGRGVLVPNTALLFRAEGPRMAVYRDDGSVALREVTLGTDNGKEVEILSGIAAGDQVITNPPDALLDGDRVRVAKK